MELRQLLAPTPPLIQQALALLESYMDVYHINQRGERFMLQYDLKEKHGNTLHIEFTISGNTDENFIINVYNPVNSPVSIALDLIVGKYRLVN